MRWYRLTIYNTTSSWGRTLSSIGVAEKWQIQSQTATPPIHNNPTPLNIQFNVTANRNLSAQVGSVLKIFNVDQSFFLELKSMVGSTIHLEAGFDLASPMVKKLKYPEIAEKTIIYSKIQAVFANFDSLEPWVAISVGPYANTEEEQKALYTKLEELSKAQAQTQPVKIQMEPQKNMKDTIIKLLRNFFDNSWTIAFSYTITKLTLAPMSQAIFAGVYSIFQLFALLRNKWGIECVPDYTNNTLLVTTCTTGPAIGPYVPPGSFAGITKNPIKTISPNEFLSQPNALGFNNISTVIALRADLHLGDLVVLEGTIPTMSSFDGIDSFISKGINDNLKLFAPGTYMIMGINHNGEFYGADTSSWSTQLQLTLVDSNTYEEVEKNKSQGEIVTLEGAS